MIEKDNNKMKMSYPELPSGYDLYKILDMANDRHEFMRVNICSLLLVVFMVAVGIYFVPISSVFKVEVWKQLFCILAMLAGLVVYVYMHEWAHGVCIKLFTGENAEFGFVKKSGMAYAKSSFFFSRKAYIIIALAPVVLWGIILALMLREIPEQYFWYLYAIQIFNMAGAAGDFYVVWLVSRMPKKILIFDEGVSMKFFAPIRFAYWDDEK